MPLVPNLDTTVREARLFAGFRDQARRAVGKPARLPAVNVQEGHARGRPEPVQLHHVAPQPVDGCQRGLGELLFDVVNADFFAQA